MSMKPRKEQVAGCESCFASHEPKALPTKTKAIRLPILRTAALAEEETVETSPVRREEKVRPILDTGC